MIFGIGYTVARASIPAIPTDTTSTTYQELFPSNYAKTFEHTYLHYYTNDSTEYIAMGLSNSGAGDLLVKDDNANPTINVTLFTNKLNNTSSTKKNLSNCQKDKTCGKMIEFNHTFAKHIIFYHEARGTGIPDHMYFYDDNEELTLPVGDYVKNRIIPGTGASADSISDSRRIKVNNTQQNMANKQEDIFSIPKAYAKTFLDFTFTRPYGVIEIDRDKSVVYDNFNKVGTINETDEFLTGKVSDFVEAGFLDYRVFKPMSVLTSETNTSYIYQGLSVEPIANRNTPVSNYANGTEISDYLKTNGDYNKIQDLYKKHVNELTFVDNFKTTFSSGSYTWENRSPAEERRVVGKDVGPTSVKITFYNNTVQNYVSGTFEPIDHIELNDDGTHDYNHIFVYKSGSGMNATSVKAKDVIKLIIGSPDQLIQEKITNNDEQMISFYDKKNDIWNIIFPKAEAKMVENHIIKPPTLPISSYEGTIVSTMSELVEDGILPWQVFRPESQFYKLQTSGYNKSYMYWKYSVYPVETSPKTNNPASLQEELLANGTLKDVNLTKYLQFGFDDNITNEQTPVIINSVAGSDVISLSFNLKNSLHDFDFLPTTRDKDYPTQSLFIDPSDNDISDTDKGTGSSASKNMVIRACLSKVGNMDDVGDMRDGDGCLEHATGGSHMMNNYQLMLTQIETNNGNPWDDNKLTIRYDLNIWIYDSTNPTTAKAHIAVPITFENPWYDDANGVPM